MPAATSASAMSLLPISQLKQQHHAAGALVVFRRRPLDPRRRRYVVTTARLFGPAIFEASKLKVMFLGEDEAATKHHAAAGKSPPLPLPRTYTLTHSDVTASLTLAVSHTVNQAQLQGWYNRLQRDEVVAEWKKVRGRMSLHVHCHISGGHFLLDLIAGLRYYIFRKELPVVLQAFVHGDVDLFSRHPELEEATVWVYFHSNMPRFNRVECWGPLRDAAAPRRGSGTIGCPRASGRGGARSSASAASHRKASSPGPTSTTWPTPTPPPAARRSSDPVTVHCTFAAAAAA